jgi:hypothetical protein
MGLWDWIARCCAPDREPTSADVVASLDETVAAALSGMQTGSQSLLFAAIINEADGEVLCVHHSEEGGEEGTRGRRGTRGREIAQRKEKIMARSLRKPLFATPSLARRALRSCIGDAVIPILGLLPPLLRAAEAAAAQMLERPRLPLSHPTLAEESAARDDAEVLPPARAPRIPALHLQGATSTLALFASSGVALLLAFRSPPPSREGGVASRAALEAVIAARWPGLVERVRALQLALAPRPLPLGFLPCRDLCS